MPHPKLYIKEVIRKSQNVVLIKINNNMLGGTSKNYLPTLMRRILGVKKTFLPKKI